MSRARIGDVIEITTARGLAYAQYTHKHAMYGALIRVLPGFHQRRPSILATLPLGQARFATFFPLGTALKRGLVHRAGNMPIPDEWAAFPIFRSGTPDPQTKAVKVWWLWDGVKEWKVGDLNAEQWKLPIRGVWNDTLLVERVESDWCPEGRAF